MKRLRAAALVAGVALQALSAQAGPAVAERPWLPEVLGFKLGMDLREVRARMGELRLGAATVPRVRTSVGEFTPGFMAMDPAAAETNEAGIFNFTFTTPPQSDKLLFVERQVRYDKMPAKAPMAAGLKSALIEKFGNPTMRQMLAANIERMTWIWSPGGRLQTQGLGMSCDSLAGSFTSYTGNKIATYDAAAAARLDKLLQGGCGVLMQATVSHAPSGVVAHLSHHAIDMAGGVAARLATGAAANDQTQRQRQQDADQARQQKPRI